MFLNKWKHILLLLLLMGLALFVTKSFWYFPSNGIEVSFTSQAEKPIAYQVFYTTSDKRSFNADEKATRSVKAGKHQVKIMLPVEKILRFRLDLGQFSQKVTISDLKVRGKTTVIMDKLSGFVLHQIDSSKQKGNSFHFISNQPDPYIIYKTPVNIEAKRQVRLDYYILFIIAVISLLAGHKIVKYLAQFKFKESSSRIDIVFVTVFFVLLFIPMLKISGADKSEKENRMLAKYVPFIKNGQINLKYSTNFESWYNDRFFGRDFLINIWSFLEQKINPNRGNDKVLIGKNSWLFYKLNNSIENFQNRKWFSQAELERAARYLSAINSWAKENGKDFYYVIAPDKNKIYGEYFPAAIYKTKPDSQSRANQLVQYLHENTKVKVIYLYDVLMQNKNRGLLYFKNDTHWNKFGSYLGYIEIMKEIQQLRPEVPVLSNLKWEETTHYKGDLTNLLGSSKQDLDTRYLSPQITLVQDCKILKKQGSKMDIICHNPNGNLRLFLKGDSFSDFLLDYLRLSFKNTQSFNSYDFSEKDLQNIKENSDVIILETVERYIPKSLAFTFPSKGA